MSETNGQKRQAAPNTDSDSGDENSWPLRDRLAMDRTLLANERTLLAYIRTALALLLAGATIVHFAMHGWFAVVGIASLVGGALMVVVGTLRYRHTARALRR